MSKAKKAAAEQGEQEATAKHSAEAEAVAEHSEQEATAKHSAEAEAVAEHSEQEMPLPTSGGTYEYCGHTGKLTKHCSGLDIAAAIGQMEEGTAENWTTDGKPQVAALETILGHDISMEQRDAAWDTFQRTNK